MIFVGLDWAEGHHDVALMQEGGVVVSELRIPDGVEGVRRLHQLIAQHQPAPTDVIVGIETAHGLVP